MVGLRAPSYMMRRLRSRLRSFIYDVRTEGSGPAAEAAAVGVGAFIGCLPFYGLHLILCLAVGTLFRLNRLKMYLAANISNPLVAPWLLLAEVQTGAFVRRGAFHELTLQAVKTTGVSVFGGDLLIGSVVVGGLLGSLSAWGMYLLRRGGGDRFDDLARRAADRYVRTSLTAWEFARGKLRFDPLYRTLVCDRLLLGGDGQPLSGTLVEVGCGQGLALALLSEARADVRAGRWPADWAPVAFERLIGIEKRPRVAAIAAAAVADAEVRHADARSVAVERADAILFLDVLHMMSRDEQERVLAAACASLSGHGRIVVREADAAGGWRFAMVATGNRLKALAFGNWRQRFAFRTVADWQACFARLGLHCDTHGMGQGTPFANVLFVIRRAEAASPSTRRTDTSTAGVA
jgi:uncharacterized protein (DUF2062 family)